LGSGTFRTVDKQCFIVLTKLKR